MSTFQLVVTGIFGIAAVVATAVFALANFGGDTRYLVFLELWGSVDEKVMEGWLEENFSDHPELRVNYKYIPERRFDEELLEAMSLGRGPDMALISQDQVTRHEKRIVRIPFSHYSERDFRDIFTQAGEVFMDQKEGFIYGLPVLVDPLVMYWNRTFTRASGYPRPPVRWGDFADFVTDNVRQERRDIVVSAAGLGEYDNIEHSKAILSTLIFQAGGKIIDGRPENFKVNLSDRFNMPVRPAESALLFYTDFSDPGRLIYTWNRRMPNSFNVFVDEKMVVYFGMSSDYARIKEANPFLDFDVALVPENESGLTSSYSNVTGLVIMRSTKNFPAALRAIDHMASGNSLNMLSASLQGIPPSRNDLLVRPDTERFQLPVFYEAARRSFSWVDPFPERTDEIFSEMVVTVVDRDSEVFDAVERARRQLESSLRDL